MGTIHTHDSQTAPVLSGGVLSVLVQQPTDQGPSYSQERQTCQLRFKGPYNVLRNINNIVGTSLSAALSSLPIDVEHNFDFPAPPLDKAWWVASTSLEQLEAGDHAVITMSLDANPVGYDPDQESGAFDPRGDTWQLRWESYTVKPAAFCSNVPHQDRALTSMTGPEQLTGYADRQHVYYFTQAGKDGSGYSDLIGHYWYRTNDGEYVLNDAEALVLKKTLGDTNAMYHYPVLTHITVKNYIGALSSVIGYGTIGEDIDHIDTPTGCPYTFAPVDGRTWQWVKIGDDMQQTTGSDKTSFTRTETWMGVMDADPNYYGNVPFSHSNLDACRWKIGEV